jgi:hypothetical protein
VQSLPKIMIQAIGVVLLLVIIKGVAPMWPLWISSGGLRLSVWRLLQAGLLFLWGWRCIKTCLFPRLKQAQSGACRKSYLSIMGVLVILFLFFVLTGVWRYRMPDETIFRDGLGRPLIICDHAAALLVPEGHFWAGLGWYTVDLGMAFMVGVLLFFLYTNADVTDTIEINFPNEGKSPHSP